MDHKRRIIVISAVIAVIFTLLFLVIRPVTALFLISYAFTLAGLAALCWAVCALAREKESYPWAAAIPFAVRNYLIISLVISGIAVLLEQLAKWNAGAVRLVEFIGRLNLQPGWYLLIHFVLLLVFAIRVIMLRGGKEHIEALDAQTKAKVASA